MLAHEPRRHDADRVVELTARVLVALATVFYACALAWDLCARPGNGHDSIVASRGIMAENMLRWGIAGPVREYTLTKPGPDLYYAHHPFGTYWAITAFAAIFGRHAFVQRLVAVVTSVATVPVLAAIGRRLYGPAGGALAAIAYVVLPITLAFGNFPGFEVPTVLACALTTWGYLRFVDGWRRRWMAVSLAGVLLGANVDWNYGLFLGVSLGWLVLGVVFLPPRVFRHARAPGASRRFAQWAWLAAALAVGTFAAWIAYFHHIGALKTLLESAQQREKGNTMPLGTVLAARRWWIDATFTPPVILLGKIALPVLLARMIFGRRLLEGFVLGVFVMAAATYVHFKNGAGVHIYWPYAFGAYFALALPMLAASTSAVVAWLVDRVARWRRRALRRDPRRVVSRIVAVLFALFALALLPDGLDGLRYARSTGGRFDDNGHRTFRDVDKEQALEWIGSQIEGEVVVELHEGMRPTWAFDWALHRPTKTVKTPPRGKDADHERYFVGDLQFLTSADQLRLAEKLPLTVVDHFVFVDRDAPYRPAEAYVFDASEPSGLDGFFAHATEPVLQLRPDAWATWELRDAWHQAPNPPPTGQPSTLEQIRIAHNVALATGDAAAAARWEKALVAAIDRHVTKSYVGGVALLGTKYTNGRVHELEVLFRNGDGSRTGDYEFVLTSTVERRRTLSFVPPDPIVKELGAAFVPPPMLWRAGYIYAERVSLEHRPGREAYRGRFQPSSAAPVPIDGEPDVPLFALE